MSLNQSHLDALDAAIASGTLEVEYQGRRVRYQSTSALLAARNHVAEQVKAATAGPARSTFRFTFTTSRGD